MDKIKFSKTHIQKTKAHAKTMGNKYGMAIIKFDGERTFVSGNTKKELTNFAKSPLGAGDYKAIRIVPVPRSKRSR